MHINKPTNNPAIPPVKRFSKPPNGIKTITDLRNLAIQVPTINRIIKNKANTRYCWKSPRSITLATKIPRGSESREEKDKPIILCGDLNVAHKEIDLATPSTNKTTKSSKGNAGFTDKEREGFDNIVKKGFIDSFRHFNLEGENYSWWSYRANARARNIGWRIDYFCVSNKIKNKIHEAIIMLSLIHI